MIEDEYSQKQLFTFVFVFVFVLIVTPINSRGFLFSPKNQGRVFFMKLEKIVKTAVLCAISVVLLYFVRFPIIPGVTFLEYDPADICIIIATLCYGTKFGIISTITVSIIQGTTVSVQSGFIGIIMHILSTGTLVFAISFMNKRSKSLVTSLAFGTICMVFVMIPLNLVFTGLFMGTGIKAVAKMLIPAIIPFNLIKASVNSFISAIIYKRIEKYM